MQDRQPQTNDNKKARPEPEERAVDASRGEDETDLGEGYVGTTYEPSTVEVNRAREQGDGVGQKDLDYQRDPTGDKSYEEY